MVFPPTDVPALPELRYQPRRTPLVDYLVGGYRDLLRFNLDIPHALLAPQSLVKDKVILSFRVVKLRVPSLYSHIKID